MANITTTALAIVNRSLIMLGQSPEASQWDIDSTSVTDVQLSVNHRLLPTIKRVLRKHPWNTCAKFQDYSSTGTLPSQSAFQRAYDLPSDFIRIIAMYDSSGYLIDPEPPLTWKVSGNQILVSSLITNPEMEYVQGTAVETDGTDNTANWSDDLKDYIAIELALDLCMPLTNDKQLMQLLFNMAQERYTDAILADERDAQSHSMSRGAILRARYGPRGWSSP